MAASRIFFPLASSVELVEQPSSPAVEHRLKQAAILYDEVAVEAGALEILDTGGADGMYSHWRAFGPITPSRLARREVDQGRAVRYVAEFEFPFLTAAAEVNTGWLSVVDTVSLLGTLGPFTSDSLQGYAEIALTRDAKTADILGVTAMNVSSMFFPDLAARQCQPDGRRALDILFPYLGELAWEEIAEFRDLPAVEDARSRLREFEQTADERGLHAAEKAFERDCTWARRALDERYARQRRRMDIVLSLLPFSSFARAVDDELRSRRRSTVDWEAALMRLRPVR